MPVTDRREPAVYVTIEDASYVAPTTEIGRIGYTVILGDRGPHNRIVKVTSQKQFQQIFGKPNFRRCSQTFYMADKYLEYSGNLLVVRVVPDASNLSLLQTEDPYQIFSYWSNVSIVENTPVNTSDEFTFTLTSATVLASSEEAYNEVNVGDYIYHIDDAPIYATLITDKTATTDPISHVTTYSITLTSAYQGGGSITTPRTALARLITSPPVLTTGTYTITAGSTDEIICTDEYAYNEVNVGNWIYKNGDTIDLARQVYSKSAITDTNGTTVYKLVLDQSYETVGSLVNLVKYAPYVEHSKQYIDAEDEMDPASATTVYYFYAIGAGAYYNDIRIKGVRNIELERMYTDADGLAKYKYIFMDIAVYYIDGDGNEKLLEGPWSVSLIQRTPENVVIRDISSGSELYIENVINENSNYIKCVAGTAVENLITSSDAEDRRLQVMLQLSQSNPIGVNNISGNGILLQNGTDGELYDSSGNINPTGRIMGMVSQAYEGAMISIDGSVEQIREVVYPLYQPDYIICGGYPATVQAGANALSAYRQDCMCLADTGGKKVTYTQDITARRDSVSWNNWASMIYTQYRYMFDQYTGRKYWFSPVYHALQRHLIVDAAYFIAEPVAGIEKGAIEDEITLAYYSNHTERGDLQDVELNFTIKEPQGTYFLTQLTTWKRLSILKRAHVAKFVAYCRKVIPTILKDILQRKATNYWINQAKYRVDTFLSYFLENPALERYSIIKNFESSVQFDDVRSELNVYINMTPIRAIERINVYIIVQ